MLFGACCTTTSVAQNDISKLEEVVKIINDSISSMKDVFTDQKEATGITKGTTASTFDPDGGCTRAQIVTLMYRYSIR